MDLQKVDLLVVGAGPAGLAAAIKAKEAGVENVLIIERSEELGGLLHQCVHNGFGLQYFKEDLTGPEYAYRFIQRLKELGINYLLKTMVLSMTSQREVLAMNNKEGPIRLHPKAIVLAMGCRERTRYNIHIPGTRPAGIFTAGTAQRLVNVEGYIPGNHVVILGSGDIGMIMARRLTLEGAKVEAVVEILPYVGGLIRNEVQCLKDFDISTLVGHTVTEIHGLNRIEAVSISEVDRNGNPISGSIKEITCNTLLLSVGLIPENELSLEAGVELDPITGGPVVDENMQTSVPGIFAGGNVVHVLDLVDNVSWEAELAGLSAAKYISGALLPPSRKIRVEAGSGIRYVVPSYISGQKEATLYMRVSDANQNVIVKVLDKCTRKCLSKKKLSVARPSEMITKKITKGDLKSLGKRSNQLILSCVKGE
jgi:NADPH-dependent 2,4-dienoyl-CoA reductase/sulfur reductase-like enzyme